MKMKISSAVFLLILRSLNLSNRSCLRIKIKLPRCITHQIVYIEKTNTFTLDPTLVLISTNAMPTMEKARVTINVETI
jgi:hypothetical protein